MPNSDDCLSCKQSQDSLAETWQAEIAELRERVKQAEKMLQKVAQAPKEGQEMMRREGFVIDNLEDRWQKLAFSLYARLVKESSNARAWLEEGEAPFEDMTAEEPKEAATRA